MPQGDYIEVHKKRHGYRLDHFERSARKTLVKFISTLPEPRRRRLGSKKAIFVGPGFTRKPPKYERFIRPTGLWFTKAYVTHPELKCTFNVEITGEKKNPNGPMYTSLCVMTKGTIIEVNVSELGLVTPAGKVVWGKIILDADYMI
ncbi:hypothetical protein L6164_023260 [Bauhinia variegata]|uniref:Uncharacterized protein n=1 Tax=Bauhinia variegata TaxID=167791 RepID=A0ACB9MJ10_BAUVA|nr:hypothetical protein L6164_023260 [Bauhinia variegata]